MTEFSSELITQLNSFATANCFISCDVGGTNVRLSVAHQSKPLQLFQIIKFGCSDTNDMVEKFASVWAELQTKLKFELNVLAAAIDVAGPITADKQSVTLTNYPKENNQKLALSALPEKIFPKKKTFLLNDLEATCHGIIALSEANQLEESFSLLSDKGTVATEANKHYIVAAVGTGLGVGLLLWINGQHVVVACEHGHAKMSPLGVTSKGKAEQDRLFEYLSKRLYDGQHAPEHEDVVSGRGLVYCYEFLAGDKAEQLTPVDVATRAASGNDAECSGAMLLHYSYLMRSCRSLAIGVQARGVILCGDNQSHNQEFIKRERAKLMDAFLDTTKRDWIKDATILTQTKTLNANLLGCARVAAAAVPN